MYLIKRTDQGGGYVTLPGSRSSYTNDVRKARKYPTREAANKDRCPLNEVVVDLYREVGGCR